MMRFPPGRALLAVLIAAAAGCRGAMVPRNESGSCSPQMRARIEIERLNCASLPLVALTPSPFAATMDIPRCPGSEVPARAMIGSRAVCQCVPLPCKD